jgi:hypothetical protein
MTNQISSPLSVLADGARPDPWLAPTFPPGDELPRLEPGERVVHAMRQGHVKLEARGSGDTGWNTVWTPPKQASVVVTDRRIVVGCRTFDRGSTYLGMGVGALVAVGATAVSRARARRATAGQCLAMQWRHEWLTAVAHISAEPGWQGGLARLAGVPTEQTAVVAQQRGVRWRLTFGSTADPDPRHTSAAMASAVVEARLRGTAPMEPAELAVLRRLAAKAQLGGRAGESCALQIPGARQVGWRPESMPETALAPAPVPDGRRFCRNPRCDAEQLPTPLDECDLCGRPTRAPVSPAAPAPLYRAPRGAGRPACPNDACDAYGLPTPLPECDVCGRSTVF